jgi:hypothetical protein
VRRAKGVIVDAYVGDRPSGVTDLLRGEGTSLPATTERKTCSTLLPIAGFVGGTSLHRPKTVGNKSIQEAHVTKLFHHLTRQRAPPVGAVLRAARGKVGAVRREDFFGHAPRQHAYFPNTIIIGITLIWLVRTNYLKIFLERTSSEGGGLGRTTPLGP